MDSDDEAKLMLAACNAAAEVFVDAFQEEEDTETPKHDHRQEPFWKNCPKAWAGSFKGKEEKPSLVLEAVADYQLFFWHAAYGFSGNLNDVTILSHSPLLERLVDGSFAMVESDAGILPVTINNQSFDYTYFLVDGIYPQYSRCVKAIREPITAEERSFRHDKLAFKEQASSRYLE
jgi:Plant transposon protein